MCIQNLKGWGERREKKKPNMHDYFLSRAKTSGLLIRTEMTLNILEEDVPRPIQEKNTKNSEVQGSSHNSDKYSI